jgi:pyruvate/2-oxoglutarate/acetoin dehydrogenase E1 component
MSSLSYRDALNRAMADELEADRDVFLIGEDIGAAGGVFKLTEGLIDRFGKDRVRDTPISEQAIVGTAIGAAMMGLRPVVELMFADFAAVCFDQIANQLAKHRYLTDGQVTLPVTIRLINGAGSGFGAQHSQSVENWFLNIPGLKIAVPATPLDAYGLLRTAIRDPDPVLVFEHKALFSLRQEIDERQLQPIPLGCAAVARQGKEVTMIATQLMRHRAIEAADIVAENGIEAEVLDLRTLMPLDYDAIGESLSHTGRVLVVEESPKAGSWGATVVAHIAENFWNDLDAPPTLLAADETPIPYAGNLEGAWMPSAERIVGAIQAIVRA